LGLFYRAVFFIVLLDQGSKLFVQHQMRLYESIELIPHCLSLTYILNPGAAFGIFRHRTIFLIILTFLLLAAAVIYQQAIAKQSRMFRLATAIGLGGAIGNLIDRLRLGAVVDFIELPYWPVFNVADMAILIGVALIVIHTVTEEMKNRQVKRGSAE
jgi:signal peptidase II